MANRKTIVILSSDEEEESNNNEVNNSITSKKKETSKSASPSTTAPRIVSSSSNVSSNQWISTQSSVSEIGKTSNFKNHLGPLNTTVKETALKNKSASKESPVSKYVENTKDTNQTNCKHPDSSESGETEIKRNQRTVSVESAVLSKEMQKLEPYASSKVSKLKEYNESVRRQIELVKERVKLHSMNKSVIQHKPDSKTKPQPTDQTFRILESVCIDKLEFNKDICDEQLSNIKITNSTSTSISSLPTSISYVSTPISTISINVPSVSMSTHMKSFARTMSSSANVHTLSKSKEMSASSIQVTDQPFNNKIKDTKLYCFTAKTVTKPSNAETTTKNIQETALNKSSASRDNDSIAQIRKTPTVPEDDVIILDSDSDEDKDDASKRKEKSLMGKETPKTPHRSKKHLENVVGKLLTNSKGKQSIVRVESTSSPVRNSFIKQSPNSNQKVNVTPRKLNLQPQLKQKRQDVTTVSEQVESVGSSCSSQSVDRVIIIDNDNPKQQIKPKPEEQRKRSKKVRIKMLEKKLEHLEREIAKYSAQELSTGDMNQEESAYIQESKLKETFINHWRIYCKLIGEDPDLYISSRRKIKLNSTPFPELNREVERFINRRDCFPNLFDIQTVCKQANEKCQLSLKNVDLNSCALDLFTECGKKLQDQRKKEFRKQMFAEEEISNDPAIGNEELQRKFKTNRKIAKKNTDEVFADFVRQQIIQETFVNDDEELTEGSSSEDFGDAHMEALRKRNLIENQQLKRKLVNQKTNVPSKKAKRSDSTTVINVTLSSSPNQVQQPRNKIHVTVNSNPNSLNPKSKPIKANIIKSTSFSSPKSPTVKSMSFHGKPTNINKNVVSNTISAYNIETSVESSRKTTNVATAGMSMPVPSASKSRPVSTISTTSTCLAPLTYPTISPIATLPPFPSTSLPRPSSNSKTRIEAKQYKGYSSHTLATPIRKSEQKRELSVKPVLGLDTPKLSPSNHVYNSPLTRLFGNPSTNIMPENIDIKNDTNKKPNDVLKKSHDIVIID